MSYRCDVLDRRRSAVVVLAAVVSAVLALAVTREARAAVVPADEAGRILFVGFRDGNQEIYAMNPDGSSPTNLTNNGGSAACPNGGVAAHCAWDYDPSGSADGSTIVFGSTRDTGGNGELYLMNADGSGVTRLTNDSVMSPGGVHVLDNQPALSPDGRRVAWSRGAPGGDGYSTEIYVMDVVGGTPTQLTSLGGATGTPVWSPDGTRIAFYSQHSGYDAIYVMNADGTGLTGPLSPFGSSQSPDWSPDGTRIVFNRSDFFSDYEIWTVAPDGSSLAQLTNNTVHDYSPTYSPDGTQIAFASPEDGDDEIFVMNADGSGRTQLTSNDTGDSNPDWPGGGFAPPVDDEDGDGFPATTDCDDADNDVNPGATETENGKDDDCDGVVDDGFDLDDDDDGVADTADNCAAIANADQADFDSDGAGDACDTDDDGDGVADTDDRFPFDATESADNDGDGAGDNADADDDNDGQTDAAETACGSDPKAPSSRSADADGDGNPDCTDPDDNGDGIIDTVAPTNAEQCKRGGWATFNNPGFKNQGQCVSYVNARGRR